MNTKQIYRVVFNEPPFENDDRTEFFFRTLSVIYENFTIEQIGCKITRLWNVGVAGGVPYEGKKCKITREFMVVKIQDNGHIEK